MPPLPRFMPALITPFTSEGSIDWDAHAANVSTMRRRGLEGLVLGGSNGEGPFLEPGERRRLIAESAPGGALIVAIWAESVRQAMTQVEETDGAHAVLVTTPTTLARTDVAAQIRFFTEVADRAALPVYLYSVPRNTGYHLDETAIIRLSEHDNIAGMKDSGGDAVRIQRILGACHPDFAMYNGASASALLASNAGAVGAITASGNYLTGPMLELLDETRPLAERLALQHRITATSHAVERHGVAGVKVAARLTGLQPGHVRPPLAALNQSDELTIKAALESF